MSLLLAFVMSLQVAIAAAAVVQVEIPAVPGTYPLDLGIVATTINQVTLVARGTLQHGLYDCVGEDLGGPFNFTLEHIAHVHASLASGGDVADAHWFPPAGAFEASVELTPYGWTDQFLVDGTGELQLGWWSEPWPDNPPPGICTLDTAYELAFTGPLVLVIDFEGLVAAESMPWGTVKAAYR